MDNGLVPGEIRLRVPDLGRSLAFYADFLGFRAKRTAPRLAELSADGVTPLVVLEERPGATVLPPQSHTGLYHVAFLLPERRFLGAFLARLLESRMPFGHADHFVSEAIYISDPDGNGIEIYCDRPRYGWAYDARGQVKMGTVPIDADGLLQEAEGASWDGMPERTAVGHVHLHVRDLDASRAFYCGVLGFDLMLDWSRHGALFIASGGYHHHIGLNVWAGRNAPSPPPDAAGLVYYTLVSRDRTAAESVVRRLRQNGVDAEPFEDAEADDDPVWSFRDPSGIEIRLKAEG
ncbi:MAG: hypothetical protein BLM47_09395 [Candidatus Reconcilbacillus cellulovorans]|uniref:VOC domain-containing protein n=1 Tax=Candidatus Reconcilbacillus cellulovorans TaxID=1906605 RepID=A0A2A6DZN8_9BACL|nr:MAG: hypothetical protein BLM47_09395 [Candidatus Reconcilbacillus cellulovorans]